MKAIIFDMDDTLVIEEASVNRAFLETCQLAEEPYGILPVKLPTIIREEARKVWHAGPVRQYCLDIGISSWEGLHGTFQGESPELVKLREWLPRYRIESWTNALKLCSIEDPDLAARLAAAFIRNRGKYHILFSDTRQCLDTLSPKYQLGLLSNGPSDMQRYKIQVTGIGGYFSEIIISGDVGYAKPDHRIFQLMLSRLGYPPENTFMIGNSLRSDISGAQAAGMKTVWLNRNNKPADQSVIPDIELADLGQLTTLDT